MKYNLIYFDANQLEDYFFNDDYRKAYDELLDENTFIFTGRSNKDYLIIISKNYVKWEVNKLYINKIWVRGKNFDYEKYKDFDVVNTQLVEEVADDKSKTYEYLKDLMPQSNLVDLDEATHLSDTIYNAIIKPLDELKGKGIQKVTTKEEIINYTSKEPDKQFILQEFIECEDYELLGIKGTHDIRLIIVDSEIVGLSVRQPKEGGWLCNVAQGGSIEVYDWKDLDDGMVHGNTMGEMIYFKNQVLNKLPKDFKSAIFSIDFCNTKDGFKIFELNSYPGIRLAYKTYIEKVKELMS